MSISDYSIDEVIYKSEKTSIFLTFNDKKEKLVLKTTTNPYPKPEELNRFEKEYNIGQKLENISGIAKTLALLPKGNSIALLQEFVEGITLRNFLEDNKLSVEEVIIIILQLVEILDKIHKKNIIHKDVNPNNIIINEKKEVFIIDFDISTMLSSEKKEINDVYNLEGTLDYISPEQTGRMNRSIDYRSDLYSLGIVFYEMLAKKLPFNSSDPMELIHSHLAIVPKALHLIDDKISPLVSKIVLKLLAKNAEDRYQSARGLSNDLSVCLKYVKKVEAKKDDNFEIGKQDFSDKFQIPQKLYGRENERQLLLDSFEKTCQIGKAQLLLVKGYSGIGKSVLIQEVQKPITQKRGYYIKGKFEQFQRNIPYSALIQAFNELIDTILTEPQKKLNEWKKGLLSALKGNGQVIIEVIPKLELIIGKQPEVERLPPAETQNRFNYTFEQFIKVFTKEEHPITLVIDDLQWADRATLQLMELFLKNAEDQYLFILGSYRDNEVDEAHILTLSLKEIEKYVPIQSIQLKNLELAHLHELVKDTLKISNQSKDKLTKLIFDKTQGNPFFVNQFILSLYEEGLVFFDYEKFIWRWDYKQIESKNITDNVVELLERKIEKLPTETLELLKVASAFNNNFKTSTLEILNEKYKAKEIDSFLDEALKEQLILKSNQYYKFQHDRIQQASYSLIKEEDLAPLHFKIGKLLLENTSEEDLEQQVFSIVNQLNQAEELIAQNNLANKVKKLNFKAAIKAKNATAYDSALNYLEQAKTFISENIWEEEYDFAFKFFNELIEVEYLNGHFQASEKYAQISLENAKTNIEKADIYNTLIVQSTLQADYAGAITYGKNALELLDFHIPKTVDLEAGIGAGFGAVAQNLAGREILSLVDAPDAKDPKDILVAKLLVNLAPPAYLTDPNLWTFIIVNATALGLEKGNVPELCTAYSSYGILAGAVFSDYISGYHYGEFAYKLSEKYNNLRQKCNTCFVLGTFLIFSFKPIKETLPIHKEGIQVGLQSGELQFASYNSMSLPNASFMAGNPLATFINQAKENLNIALKYQNNYAIDLLIPLYIFSDAFLKEEIKVTNNLPNNYEEIVAQEQKNQSFSGEISCYNYKSITQLILGENEAAQETISKSLALLPCNVGNLQATIFNFYYPLIQLQNLKTTPDKKDEYLIKIKDFIDKLKLLSEVNPANFGNKYKLIQAEIAQIEGNYLEAMDLYEESIISSKKQGFVLENALANEMTAKFYEKNNKLQIAELYWRQAYQAYDIWGAAKKLDLLEKEHSFLLSNTKDYSIQQTSKSKTYSISTSMGGTRQFTNNLDFNTVVKASQALSEDIILDSLLEKMMKILIENSGAQRGFLFLNKKNKSYLEAELDVSTEKIITLQSIPLNQIKENNILLASEIVNYVARTRQSVVLNNAIEEGQFTLLEYIQAQKIKSLLCIPLIKTGNVVGVLYLENNLTTGAFTDNRLEILNILSSQMAISVENSQLYENLEEKVKERTYQLNEAYQEIKIKNENITDSINYAQRIQEAILPDINNIQNSFKDSFIFFQPRDIVSGDFYWFKESQDVVLIATVDCTGHGVPGAFMSMIGNDMLSELIEVRRLTNLADILTEMDKGIRKVLKQDKTDNRDGMDLSICTWNKKTKRLRFAGARNPLVFVQDKDINIIKGSKFSIGGEIRKQAPLFKEYIFEINKPTYCYIFSDGYQDQFGGPADKKFMKGNMYRLFLDIHKEQGTTQKEILEKTLNEWMGKAKQTDDILVIGFKVE